jgi:hypothetical protein
MKKLWAICLLFTVFACKKNATSTQNLQEVLPAAGKLYSGNFVNGPYGNVMGMAHIVKDSSNKWFLSLENLSSSNGPDLKVYLSKEIQPVNFINLGALKSVNGTQLYPLQGAIDFTEYQYALIHCQAFNHLFGYAVLKKN